MRQAVRTEKLLQTAEPDYIMISCMEHIGFLIRVFVYVSYTRRNYYVQEVSVPLQRRQCNYA